MPIDSAYGQPFNPPQFFASIDSWEMLTNSGKGNQSLYMYSNGILRIQIVPLDNDVTTRVESYSNHQLLTISSHFFNIRNHLYPYITGCDKIEVRISDMEHFHSHGNLLDIDWKFIKSA